MMIPSVQKFSALICFAFLAFFAASCAQPTGPAGAGDRSYGVTPPPTHSSSNFNLATPTLAGSQTGIGEVTLSWSNGGTTGSELSGGEFYPVTGEWVGSDVKPGSGHTEVYMWNDLTSAWDKISEQTDGDHILTGLDEGTYSFYVKEKSKLDATGNQTETFHSNPSNVVEIEVVNCINEWSVTSTLHPIQNPGGGVSGYSLTQKKVTNVNAAKFNLHFWLNASCPGNVTTGRTDITVHLDNPNATTNTVTATEDPLNPGRYEANGIKWNQTGIVGPYDVIIKVGTEQVVGTWNLTTTN